ncbi:hypothetical protein ikematsu_00270 [Limosilactobacillus fermentum]|nr:hypothetical protein ikematsu_00270 [Limosilactobacillus fermentum]
MKAKYFNTDNHKPEGYRGFVDGDKPSRIKASIPKVMPTFGHANDSCRVKIISTARLPDILPVHE